MAYVMAAKDNTELLTMKKACQATMDLFSKFLKEQLMDLIDKDKVSAVFVLLFTNYNCLSESSDPFCLCESVVLPWYLLFVRFFRAFLRLLLQAGVQPTLDPSAETLCWSNVLAQERKGIDCCIRVYA